MQKMTKTYRSRNRARGFTLVEVLAATGVLVTGLMAAFYLIGLGAQVNTDSRNQAIAYQAAQQQIEILRNMPFQPISGGSGSTGLQGVTKATEGRFVQWNGMDDHSFPGDANYPGRVTALANLPNGRGGVIIRNDATAGNKVKHVTVVVRWSDRGDNATTRRRNVTLNTVIAAGGLNYR